MTLLVTVAGRERTRGRALLASPGRAPLYLASPCSTPPAAAYAAVVEHLETRRSRRYHRGLHLHARMAVPRERGSAEEAVKHGEEVLSLKL
jgi:hypothetical protein